MIRQASLNVREGRIQSGSAQPNSEETLDLSDYFVMPGLIDAHTHISEIVSRGDRITQMREPATAQALRIPFNLWRDLDAGTTTIRVMGEEHWLDATARQAVHDGVIAGPDLVIATRPLASRRGHGYALSAFDGVEEIRRGARENFANGADFLKMYVTGGITSGTLLESAPYTLDEIRAAVIEAERAGKYVAAHAHGGEGLRLAVLAGVRSIEHASLATQADVRAMIDRECWLVATSSVVFDERGIELGYKADQRIQESLTRVRHAVRHRMGELLCSGVHFALGTDSMHGYMPNEMRMAVEFGAPLKEVLMAATSQAAELIGVANEVGTLQAGKRANFIALGGNPFDDVRHLARPVVVVKDGILYRASTQSRRDRQLQA